MIQINYMISRIKRHPHRRNIIETRTGKFFARKINWDSPLWHQKIKERIQENIPKGWMLGGYCLDEQKKVA